MVEMTETANILHNATPYSLILMDEIGRGTSTYDGLSLAYAAAHYLANKSGAFTLFATHYFELTHLPETFNTIVNVHLDAMEHGDKIVFMHQVKEGHASQSYGIQVAALAGVPAEVIKMARGKLITLEKDNNSSAANNQPAQPVNTEKSETSKINNYLIQILNNINADDLSPREALDLIYQLKEQASNQQI